MKTIGILGGMGPMASANFLNKFLIHCQEKYKAVQDSDYPSMILNSLSMDGFNETGIQNESLVAQQLIAGIHQLEAAGAEAIVIPCNTVHLLDRIIESISSIPLIHIVDEACKAAKKAGYKKVGILASQTSLNNKLYTPSFNAYGLKFLAPNTGHFNTINQVIEKVMGNTHGPIEAHALKTLINEFKIVGAEAVILGCTELPLAINQELSPLPIFDTNQILAEAAAEFAYS